VGPYRVGVNGAHNTVEENVGAYNTVCVKEVAEYYFCRCTGYGPWYCGFDLCALPYFLRSFPGPYRAGVPGRLVLVGYDRASRRRAVSRGLRIPGRRRGLESGVVLWPGVPVGEAVRRRAGARSECSGRSGGPESETDVVPPRPGLPVDDWIALLTCRLGIWAGPGVTRHSQHRLLG